MLFGLLILVGSTALLTLAYSLKSEFRLAIGEFGDAPYLSGFNSDEPGTPRYRWTGGSRITGGQTSALVNFPFLPASGAENQVKIQVGAASAKDSGQKNPPVVAILVNGVEIGKAQMPEGTVSDFEFKVPAAALRDDYFLVELRSPIFSASGRQLGVKVQEVTLLTAPTIRIPPFEVWFWALVYTAGDGLVALKVVQMWRIRTAIFIATVAGLALLVPLLAIPYMLPHNINLWYGPSNSTPYLVQVAAWVMGSVGVLAWVREIGNWLWEFPAKLEEGNLARTILLGFSALYVVYALLFIGQMDFIGHADYADNAVVARNLIRGNGLSADYAAQFYTRYDLPRPADTWPLLQPLMIAPFFLLFGPTAFAAKLPNLIIVLTLTWALYRWGTRYFNRKTGLVASLLSLSSPVFWETVAYPINDIGFTLFAFLGLLNLYRASQYHPLSGAAVSDTVPVYRAVPRQIYQWLVYPARKYWLWAGLWCGLLLWSKPSGAVVLVAAGLWLLYQKFFNREIRIEWKNLLLWGILALLVFSPYMARSMLMSGSPVNSTERYDVWLLEYTPWEHIYDLYYPDNRPLPEPRLLMNYGFDTVLKTKYTQFRDAAEDFIQGRYIAPVVWVFAVVGLFGLSRRRYGLLALLASGFVIYLLFINLYWHYEIRYFMVWLPWFYLLGAYGLGWLYDKMRQNENTAKIGKLGIWVLFGSFLIMTLPNIPQITDAGYTGKTGIVITSEWIKQNTPADAVIMTRAPWELSFHSDRRSVMIPNNIQTLTQLKPVIRDYKVRYLQLNYLDTGNSIWRERPALWKLLNREQVPGFNKVYEWGDFVVYEITDPNLLKEN